ncbi:MAG TPA: hypothetical protein VF283_22645 [Bryobacteraceae bacterium]
MSIRNCGWVRGMAQAGTKPVWGRRGVFTTSCPKSEITAQSLYLLEHFQWSKKLGAGDIWQLPAKVADALAVLEEAWQMEKQHGQIE